MTVIISKLTSRILGGQREFSPPSTELIFSPPPADHSTPVTTLTSNSHKSIQKAELQDLSGTKLKKVETVFVDKENLSPQSLNACMTENKSSPHAEQIHTLVVAEEIMILVEDQEHVQNQTNAQGESVHHNELPRGEHSGTNEEQQQAPINTDDLLSEKLNNSHEIFQVLHQDVTIVACVSGSTDIIND